MGKDQGRRIYEELGVRPVINAAGNMTLLGGSRVPARVLEAMATANRYFVSMEDLLLRTGALIAEQLKIEAALITPGCAAALALGSAACMTRGDREKIERLPDTTGMKNEILIQRPQRYKYDRCVTIFGAKLIEVGDARGTTAEQLAAAITDRTAAILHLAVWGSEGALPIEEVIRIGKQRGVPLLVDAASMIYPVELLSRYVRMGADLVCYGAKYFGAAQSTGLLTGRKELVDAAYLNSFIAYETLPISSPGRPLKLDRQDIIGVMVALREWLSMDHAPRLAEHQRKTQVIRQALEGVRHVSVTPVTDERSLGSGVHVTLDEAALSKTAQKVIEELREGEPSIWVRGSGNSFMVTVPHLVEGEEEIVARRLRELLA
jgi:D-glucosaminate-6-phosphate ammonia-lyase